MERVYSFHQIAKGTFDLPNFEKMKVLVAQLCPTLCNPMDRSPPGSSVHGILQAKILEWVAMPRPQGIFLTQGLNLCLLGLLHWQAGSILLAPPGSL